jgi:hypothetical protein
VDERGFDARYGDGYVLYNAEMKQERNNEMDLLLRRLGRRDGATVSDAAGDHLDADELNAYAENAVPVAARTRYTAHLAECTRCRELMVQLSASAGVVIAAETATVSKQSVFRAFLASLFTPMVLRYAAPALGLVVVAVIGFVVLRRDEPAPYITQVANNEQPSPTVSPEVTSLPGDTATKVTPSTKELDRQNRGLHGESAPVGNAAPVVAVETEAAKDAAAPQAKPEQQAASANEPAAPKPSATPEESPRTPETDEKKREAPPAPVTAAPASDKSLHAAQSEGRKTDNDYARPGTGNRRAERTDKVSPQSGGASAQRGSFGFMVETRSVAGRRFRKQGVIWIDTAYDSSRETMTIPRGSERYRALIADEPEIKTIADHLDGEIIVIWKGRAYRIR